MKILKKYLSILKEAYILWLDDKVMKLSASLSFYSILSLVPLLVIIISVAGFFIGDIKVTQSIVNQVDQLLGSEGAELIQRLSNYSFFTNSGIFTSIISFLILIIGALAVFIDLKESLNVIWGVEIKPGKGLKLFFKSRLLTFPIILLIGFLLIVFLLVSAFVSIISKYLATKLPDLIPVLQISDIIISFIVITIFFGILYIALPDVKIEVKYVWPGAFLASILFNIGKYLIGMYLGNTYYGNVFGAASSIVIILLWFYYSSMIFFFGAEFTYVYRKRSTAKNLHVKKDFVKVTKTTQLLDDAVL